jgi:hypothetical protein
MNNTLREDTRILRELASRFAVIAHDDRNTETRRLHCGVNDLKPERPIVLIEEIPWHEMNFDGSLTLQCSDPLFRRVELYFRQQLYRWRHLRADMVVLPYLPVYKHIHSTGIGVKVKEETLKTDAANPIVSHHYENQFANDEDLEKLHEPVISYDEEATLREFYQLSDAIGDLLPVKICGVDSTATCCTTWDLIATMMGVDQLLIDLVDRPEFMHRLTEKLTQIYLSTIHQYEALNLYEPHALSIHCTAASTHDLHDDEIDTEHIKPKNLWGRGAAQIFASVSPAMHDEFDIQYMKRTMEPFGLVYYGCCEPLHNKIEILEQLPHLRKISITPWADVDIAAEKMGRRYVVSAKPNPANVATPELEQEVIRKELSHILDACRRNNCSCELVLKDISTVCGRPENLFEWEKIAMELVQTL